MRAGGRKVNGRGGERCDDSRKIERIDKEDKGEKTNNNNVTGTEKEKLLGPLPPCFRREILGGV